MTHMLKPTLPALVGLWLAGCATAPPSAPEPALVAPTLLSRVAPDATWVIVVPEASRAGIDVTLRPITATARDGQPILAAIVDKLRTDGAVPEPAAGLDLWSQTLPRLAELLEPGRLEALGVDLPTAVVVHGGPLWPVARVRLARPDVARAALATLLAGTAGVAREEVAPGVESWLVTLDALRVRVGVVDDQLVAAVWMATFGEVADAVFAAPPAADPAAMARQLSDALKKTGGRRDLAVGWVRTGALVRVLGDLYASALALEEGAEAGGIEVCRRELTDLGDGLPSYQIGYRSWTPRASSFSVVADLADPELAKAVAAVGDGGVALATEPWDAPNVSLSVSLDVGKLGDLLGLLARRMAAAGYTCEEVRHIGDWLAETSMQVGLSGRLVLGGFHALHLRVLVPEGKDVTSMFEGELVAVAVHDDPETLVSMLRRFGGMEIELPPDGQTKAVGEGPGLVLGRRGRLTGFGYGPEAEARLSRVLAGGVGGPAPLLAYGVDGGLEDDYLGLLEEVDAALAASRSFPDGSRWAGVVATIGGASIDAEAAFARASALEESGWSQTPDQLLGTAIDQLIDRELVATALRRLREPSLDAARPMDGAEALVQRRLERRGKLRFTPKKVRARYEEMIEGIPEPPPFDVLAQSVEASLAHERVKDETARLIAQERKRTEVADLRAEAVDRVQGHWHAVWQLRDELAAKLKAIQANERVEMVLQVRDGMLEVLADTETRPRIGTPPGPAPPAVAPGE